jgi:hypothetical protein
LVLKLLEVGGGILAVGAQRIPKDLVEVFCRFELLANIALACIACLMKNRMQVLHSFENGLRLRASATPSLHMNGIRIESCVSL